MSLSDWQSSDPIVLDTNTTLSALIGGTTRQLIVELDHDLRYPESSFDEIQRNQDVVQHRSRLTAVEIEGLMDTIFNHIELVPEADILQYFDRAFRTTSPLEDADEQRWFGDRDESDVVFLAAAIAVDGCIWSDDGVFKHQACVPWFETSDVIEYSGISV